MRAKKGDTQRPMEIAYFRGLGIVIEVRSDNHGKYGNKKLPAIVRILGKEKRELAQIEITRKMPKKASDIVWYKTPDPPAGLGNKIIKLVSSLSKALQKAGVQGTVWQSVLMCWLAFQES